MKDLFKPYNDNATVYHQAVPLIFNRTWIFFGWGEISANYHTMHSVKKKIENVQTFSWFEQF